MNVAYIVMMHDLEESRPYRGRTSLVSAHPTQELADYAVLTYKQAEIEGALESPDGVEVVTWEDVFGHLEKPTTPEGWEKMFNVVFGDRMAYEVQSLDIEMEQA